MAVVLGKSCIDHTHEKFVAKQWMSQGEVQLSKYYALSLIKGFFDFQKVSQLLHLLVPFVLEPFPLRRGDHQTMHWQPIVGTIGLHLLRNIHNTENFNERDLNAPSISVAHAEILKMLFKKRPYVTLFTAAQHMSTYFQFLLNK